MDNRAWAQSSFLADKRCTQVIERFRRVKPSDDIEALLRAIVIECRFAAALDQQHEITSAQSVADEHAAQAECRKPAVKRWCRIETPFLASDVVFAPSVGRQRHLLFRIQAQRTAITHGKTDDIADFESPRRI